MRKIGLVTVALLAIMAGCNRGNDKMDQPLSNDLNLAAQQRPGQDTMSAAERTPSGVAPATATTSSTEHSVRRTNAGEVSTTRHRTSSSSGSSNGTTTTTTTTTVKHTNRDAAIGAAAGAVIGATTSRDKVKGGLIGAAAGGILGGIIGNNVDVQKKKKP